MFERQQIQKLFDELQKDQIDAESDMLWSFFFLDDDLERLNQAASQLETEGFDFGDLIELEETDQSPPPTRYMLRVDQIQSHSVDSLYTLNQRLDDFAKSSGLVAYDGMDVEPFPEVSEE